MPKHPGDDDSPEMRKYREKLVRARATNQPPASGGGCGGAAMMLVTLLLLIGSVAYLLS